MFVRLKKKESENENELNEKRRNFNILMPSRVLLLGFALVASRVKIQLERNYCLIFTSLLSPMKDK